MPVVLVEIEPIVLRFDLCHFVRSSIHCYIAFKNGMANKLDPMDLKQILSLHLDGLSNRDIGITLGVSRNTVSNRP